MYTIPISKTNIDLKITKEHLLSDVALKLCPAMYQEYIQGSQHIRAHVFRDKVYAALLTSNELDWRENLDIPFEIIDLSQDIKNKLCDIVRLLELKMGIIDLKLTKDNIPIWLEINPQGQFLFVEGISGLNLTSHFVNFLCQELSLIT